MPQFSCFGNSVSGPAWSSEVPPYLWKGDSPRGRQLADGAAEVLCVTGVTRRSGRAARQPGSCAGGADFRADLSAGLLSRAVLRVVSTTPPTQ